MKINFWYVRAANIIALFDCIQLYYWAQDAVVVEDAYPKLYNIRQNTQLCTKRIKVGKISAMVSFLGDN